MKVLIVEDEAPAFRRLQRIIEDLDLGIQIVEVIDSVQDAVKWFKNGNEVDLIFMDIQLADGLSFEIFKQVEINIPVIFTTAYNEYTLDAFKVNSVDYLLKPIDAKLLRNSIEKYQKLFAKNEAPQLDIKKIIESIQPEAKSYKERFLVKSLQKLITISTSEIAYFFTDSGIVYLRTFEGDKYAVDFTLDDLENNLNPKYFFRLNRQFLSNVEAIQSSESYEKGKMMVVLMPKTELPVVVSRERGTEFKRWLDLN